jgi:hypothetical protein
LVVALTKAAGDARKEQEAVQAAIDAYMELAGGGDPFDACLANFFVEDGSVERPPPIERVPGAREEDVLRWRELVLDLAGY